MVKAKEPATVAEVIKAARKKAAKETKGMSIDEILEYHRRREEAGMKRFQAAKAAYEEAREQREEQLLIRLTKSEKEILERDAAAEQAKSVSALVRSRALVKETPLQLILNRLDSITKDIGILKKKLRV